MKNTIHALLSIFFSVAILVGCNNGEPDKKPILLVGLEKGGCNNDQEKSSSYLRNLSDSIMFWTTGDTLVAIVTINYTCCTRFDALFELKNDSLLFNVNDACIESDHCYCKCMCYYTFQFKLINIDEEKYCYKFTLYNAQADKYSVVEKGSIDLSEL
jgi:hypothetical protein